MENITIQIGQKSDNKSLSDAVILIPSLEPDEHLPAYVRKLVTSGFGHVVIVDDGSSEKYQLIFKESERIDSCVNVLHHDINHGKGMAMKTGYSWIQQNLPDISGVITADADGQHTIPDCIHLAEELKKGQRALYLGSRDFNQKNVPFKSRTGNRLTSILFLLLYGKWLQDTQTGLRAFRKEDLQFMINVEGERFEYEMNVLIACTRHNIPMIPIRIETIYENENKSTHYHPVKDSMRIFRVIVRGFMKFMGASILCFLVDQGLFNLMNLKVFHNGRIKIGKYILISTVCARVISATLNFSLNKNLVFGQKGNAGRSLWRYAILCVGIMFASTSGVWILGQIRLNSTIAKLIVDTILYFISWKIQKKWVFSGV